MSVPDYESIGTVTEELQEHRTIPETEVTATKTSKNVTADLASSKETRIKNEDKNENGASISGLNSQEIEIKLKPVERVIRLVLKTN